MALEDVTRATHTRKNGHDMTQQGRRNGGVERATRIWKSWMACCRVLPVWTSVKL